MCFKSFAASVDIHQRRDGQLPGVTLHHGVIARQAHERPIPEQIGPRVADMRKKQIPAGAKYCGERRLETRPAALPRLVHDRAIHMAIESLGSLHDLLGNPVVDSQIPLAEVEHQVHERGDGEPAGLFAGAGFAQAISDDHCITGTRRID